MAADVDLVSSQGPQSTPTLEVRWGTCLLNTDLSTQDPAHQTVGKLVHLQGYYLFTQPGVIQNL